MAAAKRFLTDASGSDEIRLDPEDDQPSHQDKRTRRLPSFASVIGEAVMVNSLQHLCSALEPVLRRVVTEEVDRGLRHRLRALSRSSSLRLQALQPQPPTFQLAFSTKLALPIFTSSKITGDQSTPLQIHLTGSISPATLPSSLKVEIVVLDGDFPSGNGECWSSEEFESSIVKERAGKRPLLTGDLTVSLRDGVGGVGEIEFTDNSSWIRSRKFRIGARVVRGGSGQGIPVKEAVTEAFVVKDHRGELYKKHHPPMLEDEVWRLEKIGKDGAFHKKLADFGLKTVQDFLKLFVVDPAKLRTILGPGMSDKMWEVTIRHARTCLMGNKRFQYKKDNYLLLLSPICQLLTAVVNGHTVFPAHHNLTPIDRGYIEDLVRLAYANWNSLEMVEQVPSDRPPLLTQGDGVVEQQAVMMPAPRQVELEQQGYAIDGAFFDGSTVWQLSSSPFMN